MEQLSDRFRRSIVFAALLSLTGLAHAAQTEKTNILFIVSDDTGSGDLGPSGGGVGRGGAGHQRDPGDKCNECVFHGEESRPRPAAFK